MTLLNGLFSSIQSSLLLIVSEILIFVGKQMHIHYRLNGPLNYALQSAFGLILSVLI